MQTLFDITPVFPPGFTYKPNFISPDEEQQLLSEVRKIDLHHMQFQGYTAHRKVASFGYDYSFNTRQLTKGKDIPAVFDWLIQKISAEFNVDSRSIAELLVTEYAPGTVINWHRDAPPFDIIIGISLLSDCTFKLRPQEKTKQTRAATISFPVAKRSLYIMEGEARSDWQHSIAPVKSTRYSITVRTLKETQRS